MILFVLLVLVLVLLLSREFVLENLVLITEVRSVLFVLRPDRSLCTRPGLFTAATALVAVVTDETG